MQNITSLALPVFCPNQDIRVLPIRRTNVLPIVKPQDIWLGVDIARVFDNMTSRGSNHYRLKVHPLFSLIAYHPVTVLEKALHLEPWVTDKSLLKSRQKPLPVMVSFFCKEFLVLYHLKHLPASDPELCKLSFVSQPA